MMTRVYDKHFIPDSGFLATPNRFRGLSGKKRGSAAKKGKMEEKMRQGRKKNRKEKGSREEKSEQTENEV